MNQNQRVKSLNILSGQFRTNMSMPLLIKLHIIYLYMNVYYVHIL